MKNYYQVFCSVILAISPILGVYKSIQGLTIADVSFCIIILIAILKGIKLTSYAELKLFFIILFCGLFSWVINSSASWYSNTLFYHNLVPIVIAFATLILVVPTINVTVFKKALMVFGILASIVCIIQLLSVIVLGFFVPDMYFLPKLEVIRGLDTISMTRPCSIFTEPAHLCIYLAPIAYLMFCVDKKILGYFFIFSMICCTSTTGLILSGLILILYALKNHNLKNLLKFSILGVLSIILMLSFFPTILDGSITKLNNTDASSDVRLLGPLSYLQYLEMQHCIFGVGINQLEKFVLLHGGKLSTEGSGNYTNATLYMFFSYGIIGFIGFMSYLLKKFRLSSDKGFWIIAFAIFCSDQVLFDPKFLYLMTFVFYGNRLILRK